MGRKDASAPIYHVGIVYHVFNKANGKCYVGQTNRTLEERWNQHVGDARYGSDHLFHRAIRKYGIKSFVLTRLCEVQTQADLDAAELYFGQHFHALAPEGYCLRLGEARGITSEETKEKIRQKRYEWTIRNGVGSPRYGTGKKMFDGICPCGNKFRGSVKKKYCSSTCYGHFDHDKLAKRFAYAGASATNKPMKDLETGKVYFSVRETARELGITRWNLLKKMAKGERFVYVEKESVALPIVGEK